MIIKITPDQVVAFWEAIKYGTVKVDKPMEFEIPYCNHLLERLLSGDYQCWVAFDVDNGEKTFIGIMITGIGNDPITGSKILYVHNVYAFRPVDNEVLLDGMSKITEYARATGCYKISTHTDNVRLQKLLEDSGFRSLPKYYDKEV